MKIEKKEVFTNESFLFLWHQHMIIHHTTIIPLMIYPIILTHPPISLFVVEMLI